MARERVMKKEADVRKYINKLLDQHGWFHWNVVQGPWSASGVVDKHAIRNNVYIAIEAKFGSNKPTLLQKAFLQTIAHHGGFAFVVNEKNIVQFALWLETFDAAVQHAAQNKGRPSDEQGAIMLDCIKALTEDIVTGKQLQLEDAQ